ncbi:MAG: Crp/Fnr family transcriptional regulator [Lachnospiraceae bacterium]|nr:Crp/Fnr family transcriptional regulator [Lachnospiraceae bacterium]
MDTSQLTETALFKGMSPVEIDACLKNLNAQAKKYKRGSIILHAGDHTSRMGLVISGSVTIESNDIWGNLTVLSHAGAGQFFAETYAMLPDEVMLVDVRANEDCEILFLSISGMLENPVLTRRLLMITARKNLLLSGRSFHTAPKSARSRILAYLHTVSLQKGSAAFDIPFSRQQMADYLNLERTALSKELGRMRRDGIIECRKNHFVLL